MPINDTSAFWSYSSKELMDHLNSTPNGLSNEEAQKRFKQFQPSKKQVSKFRINAQEFLGQFKSPLMLLLIGAVIISAFLGDTSDVFIILFIVFSTGIMSFWQERKAKEVVAKLQSLISLKSTVLRAGIMQSISSKELVPGDVLIIKAGDLIAADCVIIDCNELYANEASLSGESYPARKNNSPIPASTALAKRSNCLWAGTSIVSGHATALVINTNEKTILGSISESVSKSYESSFETGIKDFGVFLMKITLILASFVLVFNLIQHKSPIESALFALALAVGMAPELLPAITTIAMSAGAKRMLDKKVIVKKLSSIQSLGEVDLLCTDKTGTITEGSIQIASIIDTQGKESNFVKKIAYWNAALESGYSNPIDQALKNLEIEQNAIAKKIVEIPYDFTRKRLSIAMHLEESDYLVTKGAFKEIISICSQVRINEEQTCPIASMEQTLLDRYNSLGNDGYRVIGICYKTLATNESTVEEKDMIFAGFVALQDPIKEGIQATIAQLQQQKVQLKIITGDNSTIAKTIALKLGIQNPQIMRGDELMQYTDLKLAEKVKNIHLFAEVAPQQKEQIILALKKSYTVAYMGDGINDVAAINAADVGISVDNAVDVAKEAADFVLLEKSLDVIAVGIMEGRKTFANTLKYIFINTGSTFGNMISVAIASMFLPFLPMLPKQILLTNFITDFPYLSVASDNVDNEQLQQPGKWNLKLIRKYMLFFGIHSSLFDALTFFVLLKIVYANEAVFQTGWFVESILTELFILFIIRTHKHFFKSKPGKYLLILSILGLLGTLYLPYAPFGQDIGLVPLSFNNLLAILFIVLGYIITADLLKKWFFKKYSQL